MVVVPNKAVIATANPIHCTWVRRNRLNQTAPLSWTDPDQEPEVGQTTTIIVYKLDGMTEITRISGLTGTSYDLPWSAFGANDIAILKFISERDGYESLTGYAIQVTLPNLTVSGEPVLTATQGAPYAGFTATAHYGSPPYTYSLVGTWPAGITINPATGAVAGTPTVTGSFAGLSVRVTDALSDAADLPSFTLAVAAAVSGDFELTDSRKTTGATPTFTNVGLGAAHANREIVIELSYGTSAGFVTFGTTTVTVGSVPLTRVQQAHAGAAASPSQRAQIFRGNVPLGTAANVTVTNTGTHANTAWSMKVWRGIGPYYIDSKSVLEVSLGTPSGVLTTPGNGFTFAVSSRAETSTVTDDTSLSGISATEQNASAAAYHRGSHGYQAFGSGLKAIGSSTARALAVATLRRGAVSPLVIALVTQDTANAAATNTKAALDAFGHTVTLIADSAIGSTNFASYDLIVAVRSTATSATSASAVVAGQLRALVNGGKPLVIGGMCAGPISAGTGRSIIATLMNLTGTWTLSNSATGTTSERRDSMIVDIGHTITDGFDVGLLPIYSDDHFRAKLTAGQPFVGVRLANGVGSGSAEAHLIAIPAGTTDLAAGTVGSRVVVGDLPYAALGAMTQISSTLLNRMCLWAAGKIG